MYWALAIYSYIRDLGLALHKNLIPKNIREKILGLGHILYTGFGQVFLLEILNLNFVLYQSIFWNLERLYILVISFEHVIVM